MDTFLDVTAIVKRGKQVLNLKRDSELAEYLGVYRATVSNWRVRNRIDFPLLLDKMGRDVDYNWLLVGKGDPKHHPIFRNSGLAQGEVEIIHNPKTRETINDRSVTMCNGAIYVSGDSMCPILKSGDIVGYNFL